MSTSTEPRYLDTPLELSLDDHKVSEGSIGYNRDATTFAFTIGPVSDATMAALESAAEVHGRICLYCCREPLLIDLVALERRSARKIRIVGRLITTGVAARTNLAR